MTQDDKTQFINSLAEQWPRTFVLRSEVGNFSAGLITPGTIRNLDSQGKGPRDRFRIGKRVCYPTSALVEFLKTMTK